MITVKINMVITQDYFFTVTDSLMYELKTEGVYKDFSYGKEIFDFSNYELKMLW